jgi:hypothetical protein
MERPEVCILANMAYSLVASQMLRHLRGRRSQAGWSKCLGFKSNIAT